MNCANCGAGTSPDARFCGSCGSPAAQPQTCPHCRSPLSRGDAFCGNCGARVVAPAIRSAPPPIKEAASREALLRAMEKELSRYPQLQLSRGQKSDLVIKSALAEASWGPDKKKVEYSASLLADETERTLVYWEMIKESGRGMGFLAGFKVESYRSDGKTISGKVREMEWSPAGKAVDYSWDYAQTRTLVEGVVKAHGWRFATTLRKGRTER